MEAPQPDLNDQESGSKGLGGIGLWLAVVVCAYVFSIGPVTGFYERTGPHSLAVKQTYRLVYAPVVGVLSPTPLKSALLWWIKLWVDAFNPKMNLAKGSSTAKLQRVRRSPELPHLPV